MIENDGEVPVPEPDANVTTAIQAPGVSWAPGMLIVPHCVVDTSAVPAFETVRTVDPDVNVRVH